MIARLLLASATLALAVPAQAGYVFNPADLPKDFACDKDWNSAKCDRERKHEAWWNIYGERYDRWFHEQAFDVNIYFAPDAPISGDAGEASGWDADSALGAQTPNLADAVYSIALQRFGGWAFAVDMVCPEVRQGETRDNAECAPKLRMVSPRNRDEVDASALARIEGQLPITPGEVAERFRVTARWEEADLRTCKGALDQLLALPVQRGAPIWDKGYVKWLRGRAPVLPDEIIATADGSGVLVRARGMSDPGQATVTVGNRFFMSNRWNDGPELAWAKEMVRVVKPCLKPASAPAPWDKLSAGQKPAQIERVGGD